jgi:hypothetical protein
VPVQTADDLKAVLFDAYDGFGDKRYKDKTRDLPFIVDDRTEGDTDARGQLFLWFCQIFVNVEAADRVKVSLRGGVPESAGVAAWLADHGAEQTNFGTQILITPQNIDSLDDLISRFAAITKKPYDTRAYKFVVPRLCHSLKQLKKVLVGAWS